MKKILVMVMFSGLLILLVKGYSQEEVKGMLLTKEVSLGIINPGIFVESLIISPDSNHFAYAAERGGKWFVVLDGKEGKEYDFFLRGIKLVFDSPNSLHTLAGRSNEIFLVKVEIRTP